MPFGWGYNFWFEAAPKAMQSAIGASAKMDGVVVTVAHDEFRGMGFEDLRGFMDAKVQVRKL